MKTNTSTHVPPSRQSIIGIMIYAWIVLIGLAYCLGLVGLYVMGVILKTKDRLKNYSE